MRKGFTLIELVLVIVILAILAVVAIPRWVDLQTEARNSAELGVVGAVRGGIYASRAETCAAGTCSWPAVLDVHTDYSDCSAADPCFDGVLEHSGVTSDEWSEGLNHIYTGPTGTVYTYVPATGAFE